MPCVVNRETKTVVISYEAPVKREVKLAFGDLTKVAVKPLESPEAQKANRWGIFIVQKSGETHFFKGGDKAKLAGPAKQLAESLGKLPVDTAK